MQNPILTRTLGLLLLTAAPSLVLADYSSEILGQGPIAYYRFAENVAAPAYDYAANAGSLGAVAAGRYTGVFNRPAAGLFAGDSAVSFPNPTLGTGYSGSVNVPNHPALNPTAESGSGFTIEFWAKPTNTTAALLSPVNSMSFVSGRAGYLFYQNGATWQFRIGNTGSTTASILDAGVVTANVWQHIVGVYSGGSNGTMTVYVDGVEAGSGPVDLYEQNTDAPLCIGSTSAPNRTFDGAVDEVAFYPTALSAAQIAAHTAAKSGTPAAYAALVTGAGAVGYWRLNEPAPTGVYPVAVNQGSLGTGADASFIGGATTNGTGPRPPAFLGFAPDNKALALPTADGYVGTPLSLLNDLSAFTVTGWIKRGADISTRGGYFGQNDLLEFGDADTGTNIEAWVNSAGSNIKSPYPGAEDEWVFIALTGDGATNELYLNGESSGTLTSVQSTYGSNTFKFNIGGGGIFNTGGDYFRGEIDEVAVFSKALSVGQVKSLYDAALGNVPPQVVAGPAVLAPAGIIYATASFSLTAEASGTPPLSYQWRQNGVPLPAGTARIYEKTNASTADNGNYDVVVTNAFGNVVSTTAVSVTVNPAVAPTITTQPLARTAFSGGQFRFSVAVDGTGPFSYQWMLNGEDIPGATGASYAVAASPATAGDYSVRITNVVTTRVSDVVKATLSNPDPGSYAEAVMSLNPVAYWRLDETTGTTAIDSAGGNDGEYVGGVIPGVTEAPRAAASFPGFPDTNRAAEFDGFSGYIRGPVGLLNGRTDFTLAGWVRRTAVTGGSTGFFGQNDKVEFGNSSDTAIGCWTGNTAAGPNPLENDEWGFVVMTHQPSPGVRTVYVNGQPIGTAGYSVQPDNTQAFCIGGGTWNDIAALNDLFTGQIDEVAVFPAALTQGQVCALYLRGLGVDANAADIAAISGGNPAPLTAVNFASGDGGFTVDTPTPTGEADWAFTGTAWASPGQATAFGSDNVSYLVSPPFTAPVSGLVSLTFSHRYSFEGDFWDGGEVEVKVNDGPWLRVSAASFTQNGYNGQLRSDSTSHIAGQQGFVVDSPGHPEFTTSSCALAGVQAGDKVTVRFTAAYDNNTTGGLTPSGWEVQSLSLTQGGSGAVVSWPCGTVQQSTDLMSTWSDVTGGDPVVIDTSAAPRRFFRLKP